MTRTAGRDHLLTLARNVLDDRATEPARAGHARMLAEHAQDRRESLEVAAAVLSGSEVLDFLHAHGGSHDAAVVREARERISQRRQLAQMRDNEAPYSRPVLVVDPRSTGRQNAYPLIRDVAVQWPHPGAGRRPVIPGITGGTAFVGATLPLGSASDTQVTVGDVSGNSEWDVSTAYTNVSRQVLDWIDLAGSALMDATLHDAVDLAAEIDIVSSLEAAAGGTAAASTLTADLDAAEGAAGSAGKGPAWLLIANPVDWPLVRRDLGSAWADSPHPLPVVSSGATAGTVTLVGPDAFVLVVTDYEVYKADEPKLFGQEVVVARRFKLAIRSANAIQTITGVGA